MCKKCPQLLWEKSMSSGLEKKIRKGFLERIMFELRSQQWGRAGKNSVLMRERFTKNTGDEGSCTENTAMLNLSCQLDSIYNHLETYL